MKAHRKPTHKQVLQELLKKPRVPQVVKEAHGDIEDAIVDAGGARGEIHSA